MLRILLICIALFLQFMGFSQTQEKVSHSLDECIAIALENNLDLQRATLTAHVSKINYKISRADILPSLNANYNLGINNGRSIDPYSNAYVDEKLTFSNAGLNLNATLFNGFRLLNNIRRDRFNLQASEMETDEAKQNLILEVTLTYLQILNNQDLVNLAELRLETTGKQTERLNVLYDEGAGNPADFTDIQGQLANDQASLIDAKNSLQSAILQLSQLLNIDYEILPQPLNTLETLTEYELSPDLIFAEAINTLPTFKAKELRVEAAKRSVNVSKASYFPEVSLFAQLNTNYSSTARLFSENGNLLNETGGFVTVNNETVPVFTNETQYTASEIAYADQFDNNLNSVIGVAVDLPIFNGFEAKNNVALQKIRLEEAKVDYQDTKSKLRQAIKQAYNDMASTFNKYKTLQDQVRAFEESFRINETRFNNGVSNIVAYVISKNNLDNAKINLANAKYEYLLRVKVLEYYRGNI